MRTLARAIKDIEMETTFLHLLDRYEIMMVKGFLFYQV